MSEVAKGIRDAAIWRDAKAVEYPDDARNAASAAALRSLADYVETIPDDPRVQWLDAQRQHPGDGFFVGAEAARLLSRYGFDGPVRHAAFLGELCVLVAEDVLALVAEEALSPEDAAERYRVSPRDAGEATIEPMYRHELAEYADPDFLRDLCLQEAVAA